MTSLQASPAYPASESHRMMDQDTMSSFAADMWTASTLTHRGSLSGSMKAIAGMSLRFGRPSSAFSPAVPRVSQRTARHGQARQRRVRNPLRPSWTQDRLRSRLSRSVVSLVLPTLQASRLHDQRSAPHRLADHPTRLREPDGVRMTSVSLFEARRHAAPPPRPARGPGGRGRRRTGYSLAETGPERFADRREKHLVAEALCDHHAIVLGGDNDCTFSFHRDAAAGSGFRGHESESAFLLGGQLNHSRSPYLSRLARPSAPDEVNMYLLDTHVKRNNAGGRKKRSEQVRIAYERDQLNWIHDGSAGDIIAVRRKT